MTLSDAQQIKNDYPELVNGFSLIEIDKIWSEYSDMLAASWMTPSYNRIKEVFNQYR